MKTDHTMLLDRFLSFIIGSWKEKLQESLALREMSMHVVKPRKHSAFDWLASSQVSVARKNKTLEENQMYGI